ncbi:MAG TPA: ABC transporter ATP-binding protein [Candidatus Binatia bacterium]|nr:ABC transporter ATP-binding protein [Candidatus Binatia bacterium]
MIRGAGAGRGAGMGRAAGAGRGAGAGGGPRGGHHWLLGDPADKPSGRVPSRRLARRALGLFRHHRGQVVVTVALIVFTSGVGVVNPLLIKVVFDTALFPVGAHGQLLPPDLPRLIVLCALMIAIPVFNSLLGIAQTYFINNIGQRVMEDLRNLLYEHLQGLSLRFFTSTRTGDIQSRFTNDVGGIQSVVTDTASSIVSNSVTLVSTLVAMVVLSWQLTVLSLFMMPLFLFLTYRAGNARRKVVSLTQESKSEISAMTQETLSISGILLGKTFGRQREEQERFRNENRRLASLSVRSAMVGRGLFAMVNIFFSSAPALVYLVAGVVLLATHSLAGITPGTIVAMTTLQSRLFFPLGQMLQISVEIQSSLALFERVFEYLDIPQDIVDSPGAVPLPGQRAGASIVLDDVYFRYDPAQLTTQRSDEHADQEAPRPWAIEDLSLRVRPGQLAAIVGPTGAGKTTISYLIPRLYDVTEGTVRLDGHDVRDLTLASIAEQVGMVTQETYLFHDTIRRNLLYAKPEATQEELEAASRAAFIHERIAELADGYDTIVGERGYRLSGGEKQRLAIARVILKAPRILILDEATSALDTASERLVQAALTPLMRGRTTIAIAHRLSTILAADVIFVIDRGRLVEQGSHDELLRLGGLYAALYEQQFAPQVLDIEVPAARGELVGAEAADDEADGAMVAGG